MLVWDCLNCGEEYEGMYCPNCGVDRGRTSIAEDCLNCGEEYEGMYCPNCGVDRDRTSIEEDDTEPKVWAVGWCEDEGGMPTDVFKTGIENLLISDRNSFLDFVIDKYTLHMGTIPTPEDFGQDDWADVGDLDEMDGTNGMFEYIGDAGEFFVLYGNKHDVLKHIAYSYDIVDTEPTSPLRINQYITRHIPHMSTTAQVEVTPILDYCK